LQDGNITLLGEVRLSKYARGRRSNRLQRVHGIGDQQSADARTHNDQKLRRLHQNSKMPLLHQKAADYGSENQQDSYDGKHRRASLNFSGFEFADASPRTSSS